MGDAVTEGGTGPEGLDKGGLTAYSLRFAWHYPETLRPVRTSPQPHIRSNDMSQRLGRLAVASAAALLAAQLFAAVAVASHGVRDQQRLLDQLYARPEQHLPAPGQEISDYPASAALQRQLSQVYARPEEHMPRLESAATQQQLASQTYARPEEHMPR